MLLPTLILAAAALPDPAPVSSELRGHVQITAGRGVLVTASGARQLGLAAGRSPWRGNGHLELGAGSRAQLVLQGRGQVRLYGPASLGWTQENAGDAPRLDFGSLGTAEVEVRRGTLPVDLPHDWRLALATGAYALERLPEGGTRLEHLGGRESRIAWVGDPAYAPAPASIRAGDRAELFEGFQQPTARRGDEAAAWNELAWSWGSDPIPSPPDLPPGPLAAWSTQPWPWSPEDRPGLPWGASAWPWRSVPTAEPTGNSRVVPEPLPGFTWPWRSGPAPLQPSRSPSPLPGPSCTQTRSAPVPGATCTRTGEASVPLALRDEPTRPAQGSVVGELSTSPGPPARRGLDADQRRFHGAFSVEKSVHLSVERERDGWRISLSPAAPGPAWVFNDQLDLQLFAGAVLLVDLEGSLRYHSGTVRILPRRDPR